TLAGLLLPALALASAGDLDPGFGADGTVVTDFGGDERGNAVAVAKDGTIYVGGSSHRVGGNVDFMVVRYTAEGQLDTAWGNGGRVTTDLGGHDNIFALALQKDGRIVVGGSSKDLPPAHPSNFALARYMPDGQLDPSFGISGNVLQNFDAGIDS